MKMMSAATNTESTATVGGTEVGSTSWGGTSSRLHVERKLSGHSSRSRDSGGVEDKSNKAVGSGDVDGKFRPGLGELIHTKEEHRKKKRFKGVEKTEDLRGLGGLGNFKPRLSQAKKDWSIQAVKGKVTTRCLWHACKALTFGVILILIGAGMATVGYYAEEANIQRRHNLTELRNQQLLRSTTTLAPQIDNVNNRSTNYWKPPQIAGSNEPKRSQPVSKAQVPVASSSSSMFSFGLNKLSYVGPIVMGVGGFVIVAACVMTFEARDSAAKIVPARYRAFPEHIPRELDPGFRHSANQTNWETLEIYGAEIIRFHHEKELISRRAMTSAFIRFSKTIQSSMDSGTEYYEFRGRHKGSLMKCPSAPSLIREFQFEEKHCMERPRIHRVSAFPKPANRRRMSTNVYSRQTMSVDNPAIKEVYTYPAFIGENEEEDLELGASATGVHRVPSDESLALDLHLPRCAVTLSIRDSSRSPSGQATDQSEPSVGTPLLEPLTSIPFEEIAGPSGIQLSIISPKVDKQTSTSDHADLSMMGWSRDTTDSKDSGVKGFMSFSRATSGGSFRELRKPRSTRKVKRSETIDTASNARKKHNKSQRSRTGKMAPDRSETARRHQLLRQPKIEAKELHDCSDKGAHAV